MKLELKHLAPYLPYDLKATENGKNTGLVVGLYNKHNLIEVEYEFGNKRSEIDLFKPVLKPIEDFENEVESSFDFIKNPKSGVNSQIFYPYDFAEYCFKNHYDVFGLIEKGLAVDINTLPQQ